METIIKVEFVVNLVLLLLFYMHMFQLNSYFIKKYARWIKSNSSKVIIRSVSALIPTVLLLINNNITKIIAGVILLLIIFFNIPKKKSKIPLKFTKRVIRMFITISIVVTLICIFCNQSITFGIINVFAFLLCVIAHIINFPIEYTVKSYYIASSTDI